jgi:hypothetical protein
MANFGALGTLRHAYRTLIKPSTSALVRSVQLSKRFSVLGKSENVIVRKRDTNQAPRRLCLVAATKESSPEKAGGGVSIPSLATLLGHEWAKHD